jgi:uncharacterized protein (TIGR03382 family)
VFLASSSLALFSLVSPMSLAVADDNADAVTAAPRLAPRNEVIVGGTDVPAGKWPDTVAVLGETGVCSGTLIAPDVVLTAGHCADIEPTTVVANTIDYTASGGTKVDVARTVAYPNWENTYDVAIVVLAQPISGVTPRRIGTSCSFNAFASNVMVRLVGFGATDMQGEASNTQLKEAMTAVVDPMCSTGNGCNTAVAPGGEFIAGGTGTADSCFGDSGGPVYLDTPRGPIVVGAVSRGVNNAATPCGGGGIYVRTDKIAEWIEETVGNSVMKDECVGSADATTDTGEDDESDETNDLGGCSAAGGAPGSGSSFVVGGLVLGLALFRRRRRVVR